MNDVFGNELSVGDTVAVCVVGYSQLTVGTVHHFTPKMVAVTIPCRYSKDETEIRLVHRLQIAKGNSE